MLSLQDYAEAGCDRAGIEPLWPCRALMSSKHAELTGVSHELKRAAEFSVAGCRASTHVEDIGGEGGETLDVSVPRWGFYDSVASFILVLRDDRLWWDRERKREQADVVFLQPAETLLFWRFISRLHHPWDPSPSHSTWPHTPGWPHWLYPVAARPARWCVSWYPSPGWKSLERELVRWSKRGQKKKERTILAHCFLPVLHVFSALETSSLFYVALLNPPLFAPAEKVKQQARPQGNHFHLSLNLASVQNRRRYRAVWPHSWIAKARVYGNTLLLN